VTASFALLNAIRWDKDGLVPVIVQDAQTNAVLTLAYMNREALSRTLALGETVFWSRSRQALWHKGETSGNTQSVVDIRVDCDADALLVRVKPAGPACHTGAATCFFRDLNTLEAEVSS
jgi:phosphoribosyl-AMP cyclohydrolase